MRITHNGAPIETEAPTLESFLTALLGPLPPGCAVAVNGEVVPRAGIADRALSDGDAIEVVTAVAGG